MEPILIILIALLLVAILLASRSMFNSSKQSVAKLDVNKDPDQDFKIVAAYSFLCGVAGESFRNEDGTSRQEIIRNCRVGDSAHLSREPNNRYDKNAIAVSTSHGKVGYIKSDTAFRLAEDLDAGYTYSAKISKINGGIPDKPTLGLVLELTRMEIIRRSRFELDLVGERGFNTEGCCRQDLIAKCHIGDEVALKNTGHDIAVLAKGKQIGSVGKGAHQLISELLDAGKVYRVQITDISPTKQVRIQVLENFGTD